MRIDKKPANRAGRLQTVLDRSVLKSERSLRWGPGNETVNMDLVGNCINGATYRYRVSFSREEVLRMISGGIAGAGLNRSERADAAAALARLREYLTPPGEEELPARAGSIQPPIPSNGTTP
jgi:hypothetical protein